MKLIKPSAQIIEPTGYAIDDIYKSIELAGRVSHRSEDKITETSAKIFVDRMINMNHLATCEFGTVYLKIPAGKYQFLDNDYFDECDNIKDSFYSNPYTKIHCQEGYHYISTNYRVLLENFSKEFISELLQYLCEPTEYHHKRYTVKYICDRAIANEIVRHRKFSFLQESSRYCLYSSNKFNNELTFIKPCWLNEVSHNEQAEFINSLIHAENTYINLTKKGWKAEQARNILPLSLKTELYMCGFAEDWKKFFELRDDKQHVHPQAYELAHPLHEEFIKRGYINE